MSLHEITLPAALTEIGELAFYRWTSLTEMTLPPSLAKIGKSVFNACTSVPLECQESRIGCGAGAHVETDVRGGLG